MLLHSEEREVSEDTGEGGGGKRMVLVCVELVGGCYFSLLLRVAICRGDGTRESAYYTGEWTIYCAVEHIHGRGCPSSATGFGKMERRIDKKEFIEEGKTEAGRKRERERADCE